MFSVRSKKLPKGAPITMRMMGLSGSSPLTTIGLSAMSQEREVMNHPLYGIGYLTAHTSMIMPFFRYEALIALLYSHYTASVPLNTEYDAAFLRAAADMTAMWRYKLPAESGDVERSQKWILEISNNSTITGKEIKNTFSALLDVVVGSLSDPPVDLDEFTKIWTSHVYDGMITIPSYTLVGWMSKIITPSMQSFYRGLRGLAELLVSTTSTVTEIRDTSREVKQAIVGISDDDARRWYAALHPEIKLIFWEMYVVARPVDCVKLHNSMIFLVVAAMGKTGTVTANWLENRRSRWGSEIKASIDDDSFTGTNAIRAYFDRNCPTEEEKEIACQFLAATYFAAKSNNNVAIAWMIEQSRNHNISSAVAFATLIVENDYISLAAIMRKVPKVQFDKLLLLILYAIQDPYANYIFPKVFSSQYKDLARIGTIHLNATSASATRTHLTNKSLSLGKQQAIESELKKLIGAKSKSEAALMFDNTAHALSQAGYQRYAMDGDNVYLDPQTESNVTGQMTPEAREYSPEDLMRIRRDWPAEARSYSQRAIVLPYEQVVTLVMSKEGKIADAYKNLLAIFLSSCEQITMNLVEEGENSLKFKSRITPISSQVRALVADYDKDFIIPTVPENPPSTLVLTASTTDCFKILFNPISVDRPTGIGNETLKFLDTLASAGSPMPRFPTPMAGPQGPPSAMPSTSRSRPRMPEPAADLDSVKRQIADLEIENRRMMEEAVEGKRTDRDQDNIQIRDQAVKVIGLGVSSLLQFTGEYELDPEFELTIRDLQWSGPMSAYEGNDLKYAAILAATVLRAMSRAYGYVNFSETCSRAITYLVKSALRRASSQDDECLTAYTDVIVASMKFLTNESKHVLDAGDIKYFATGQRFGEGELGDMTLTEYMQEDHQYTKIILTRERAGFLKTLRFIAGALSDAMIGDDEPSDDEE